MDGARATAAAVVKELAGELEASKRGAHHLDRSTR